ncbi:hypothetical protein B0I35DRAFT_401144 [Stachybotrys elegans]|uniref:Uncharacterized protein n=1 Tax=Stachybotrys elegans TaxID=80388 RepID=A0A8K0SEQ8_9HYPO|nr:hypothetical protein B0I35DRAFT_401144 [Stachybotrys elegans]
MALPPQQPGPPAGAVAAAPSVAPPHPPPPPPSAQHGQPHSIAIAQTHQPQTQSAWTTLPAPPQQWQGAEESMRTWLQTKAEEEKTRQEEERTRQKSLRLEQRKVEMEMLRASLGGGIPPPMVPLVFAGMASSGGLPQVALEWAQQHLQSYQATHGQLLPASQGQQGSDHPRDVPLQTHGQYSTPATSTQGPGGYGPYTGSLTRSRGRTIPGAASTRPPGTASSLIQQGQGPPVGAMATHVPQTSPHVQTQAASHETSPSIYFHHWQPPTSQAGAASNRPGSPTGENPRKRKATSLSQSQQAAVEGQSRSPPIGRQQDTARPTSPTRRGHKRNRSDLSWYQPSEQSPKATTANPHRTPPPPHGANTSTSNREAARGDVRKHSVTSLLSGEANEPAMSSQGTRLSSVHHTDASEHFSWKGGESSARTMSPRKDERGPEGLWTPYVPAVLTGSFSRMGFK